MESPRKNKTKENTKQDKPQAMENKAGQLRRHDARGTRHRNTTDTGIN